MSLRILQFDHVSKSRLVTPFRQFELYARGLQRMLRKLNPLQSSLPIQKRRLHLEDDLLPQVIYGSGDRMLPRLGLGYLISGQKAVEDWPRYDDPGVEIIGGGQTCTHSRISGYRIHRGIIVTLELGDPGTHRS